MGIPDHLTCLLRNLYTGQEAIVRTGHETTDWFQIGKGVHQGCKFALCLFNLHAVSSVSSDAQSCQTLFDTPWTAACQASLSITNSQILLKHMLLMPSKHLMLHHPLLLIKIIIVRI